MIIPKSYDSSDFLQFCLWLIIMIINKLMGIMITLIQTYFSS